MNLIDKCRKVVTALSQEHGAFTLFALFEPEETPGKWELLFAAPWVTPSRSAIKVIVDALTPELSPEDWQSLAGIIPLSASLPYVRWIARHYPVAQEPQELTNVVLDGVFVSHGYLLAAKPMPEEVLEPTTARLPHRSPSAPPRRARTVPTEQAA